MSKFSAGSIGGIAVNSVDVDFTSISDTGSQIIIENTIQFGVVFEHSEASKIDQIHWKNIGFQHFDVQNSFM